MANYPTSGISSSPATHGVVLDELKASALVMSSQPPAASTKWWTNQQSGGTQIHSEGQIQAAWFPVPFGVVIDGVAAEVTTAGTTGALWRYMLYKHNVSTGLPDALLSDLGTVNVETTGIKSIATTGDPSPDNYGGIWVAYVNQGGAATRATVRRADAHSPAVYVSTASINTNISGWQTTATTHTGAAPANIGALSISGNVPRFQIQFG